MANRSSNTAAVPEAKGALDKFKFEVASELGVPLSDGYNGNLTSKQNGSVGGYMVKKMIEQQERQMSGGSSGQYEQPLILSNRYRKYMLSAFEQAGLFCDIYLTCEDARTAMTMAEKGLGIALLPASMLPLSHQLKACAITDADLTTEILLAWRKGRLPSELRDFLKMWNET